MRNFTVFAVMAAMSFSAFSGQRSAVSDQRSAFSGQLSAISGQRSAFSGKMMEKMKKMVKLTQADARAVRPYRALGQTSAMKVADPRTMKWGTLKAFGWNGEEWEQDETYSYVYNAEGLVGQETIVNVDGEVLRTVYEYNADGMKSYEEAVYSEDGVNFEPSEKVTIQYDPILTNLITFNDEWKWNGNEWAPANNYKRIITRDEKGNITSSVIAVLFEGEYDPTIRVNVTYGSDGKATEIAEQVLDYNGKDYYWEPGARVSDIVWERTDGQIYDTENIFVGANRMKSGRILDEDGMDVPVSVEYPDPDTDAYIAAMEMTMDGMTMISTLTYTPLPNGGGKQVVEMTYMGMVLISMTEELRIDDWGLQTYYGVTQEGYDGAMGESYIGDVEYDAEGKPKSYTVSYRAYDEVEEYDETEYVVRAEYSDYVDVAADVRAVGVSDASGRCFDLQGRPVGAPEKGQIVIRDGKTVMSR